MWKIRNRSSCCKGTTLLFCQERSISQEARTLVELTYATKTASAAFLPDQPRYHTWPASHQSQSVPNLFTTLTHRDSLLALLPDIPTINPHAHILHNNRPRPPIHKNPRSRQPPISTHPALPPFHISKVQVHTHTYRSPGNVSSYSLFNASSILFSCSASAPPACNCACSARLCALSTFFSPRRG